MNYFNPEEIEHFKESLTQEEKEELADLINLKSSYSLEYFFGLTVTELNQIYSDTAYKKKYPVRRHIWQFPTFDLTTGWSQHKNLALKKIIEEKRLHQQNQAYLNGKEIPSNKKNQANSHLVHFSKRLIYFLVIVFVFVLWLTLR